jgi:hypothetical protein
VPLVPVGLALLLPVLVPRADEDRDRRLAEADILRGDDPQRFQTSFV